MLRRKPSFRKNPHSFRRLLLECLEDRFAPAAISWTGNADGTSWNNPGNWNTNAVPGSADDVTINVAGAVVHYLSGTSTVNSITDYDTLVIGGGSLSTTNGLQVQSSGTLDINGGTLLGSSVTEISGAILVGQGGTLDGVTVNGNVQVVGNNGLNVKDGLTLNGAITLGDASGFGYLNFQNTQTLGGSGTVTFGSQSVYNAVLSNGSSTLTIGSGINIGGQTGYVGYSPDVIGGQNNVTVVNQGTIEADANGGEIYLDPAAWSSSGILRVANGGTLSLQGTCSNAGATLTLDGSGGTFPLSGSIVGGTVNETDGAELLSQQGTLDGVTLDGAVIVDSNHDLNIKDGLTLNATLTLGDGSGFGFLYFNGTQTLSGSGTVTFGSQSVINALQMVTNASSTLTIGSGITINGQTGYVGYDPELGGTNNVTVVNQGNIQADTATGTIYVDASENQNSGVFEAANGGTLSLPGASFTNIGVIEAETGSTVSINGSIINTGSIVAVAGMVEAQSGTFNFNGGSVDGSVTLINSALNIVAAASQAASFDLYGSNTLSGNLNVGQTLIVETDSSYPNSTLTLPNGMNNSGLIGIAPGATVSVAGTSLTNNPSGVITGGGTLNISGVTFVNDGIVDLTMPSVLDVEVQLSTFQVTYVSNGGMNAATVTNPANYSIVGSGGDGIFGNGNDVNEDSLVSGITYNSATGVATINFSQDLPADFYQVSINGNSVQDSSGKPLYAVGNIIVTRVLGIVAAEAALTLDPGSDSGAPDHPGYTNVTRPTFDVQVNQAGTIFMDFDGNSALDQTLSVPTAGTYQFTAPPLADGAYTATASFSSAAAGIVQSSTTYTVDTQAPSVASVNPVGTVNYSVSQATVTFSEPVDLNTFTSSAITLSGPGGVVPVSQPQLVSGSTYNIDFPTETAQGSYLLSIAATVADYAGNQLGQSYSTSFTISLPDLQVAGLVVASPASAQSGSLMTVTWDDTDTGNAAATGSWVDTVTVLNTTTGATLATGTVPYDGSTNGSLQPGGFALHSYAFTLPDGEAGVGNIQVAVTVNSNETVLESSFTNNTASISFPATLANYADLVVATSSIEVESPATVQSGAQVEIGWDDYNQGDGAVNAAFSDYVLVQRVNADNSLTTIAAGNVNGNATLAAGGASPQTFGFTLPDGSAGAGNFLVTVTTDSGETVKEYDPSGNPAYSNNTNTGTFGATLANYADLAVANLAVQSPASPQSGSQVTVGWDDSNIGDGPVNAAFSDYVLVQRVNADNSLTTIAAGNVSGNATLAAGAVSPQTFGFTLPDGSAGTGNFLVTVTTDSGETVEEYDANGNPAYGNNSSTLNFAATTAYLPDLVVSNVTIPASGYDNAPLSVAWTVTNIGQYPASGSWLDNIYFDPVGGPQSASPADEVVFDGTVNAGQSYTQTDTFPSPTTAGQYTVRVVTDANQAIQELSYANNTGSSAQPFNDQASYQATVSTTVTTVPNGTPIPLSGVATFTSDGTPAANVPVAVQIIVAGTTRTLTATTDANGDYSITFQPLQYEAGEYSVTAADPGVTNPPVQAQFQIVGMTASPANASVQIIPGTPLSGQITLTDLSSTPLTGLTATSSGGPTGLTVDLTPPSQIAGNGMATLAYSLTTTSNQASSGEVVIQVTTTEGAVLDIPIDVSVLPLTPMLATNPGSLESGMVVGAQSLLTFTVVNNGGGPSGDLQISLPSTPYISLASPATIPSLAPGDSFTVTLQLTPPSNLPLEEYTGTILISNTQTGISVPFTFTATTSAVGDVHVLVDDDFTTQESGAPHVQGATVNLLNAYDNSQVVATGMTDATGAVAFTNIPAGPYVLQVEAAGHATYESSYTVVPGITNTIEPFIQRQFVTYTWVVQPTPIPDSYTINLQATFVADVPAPVVTITAPPTIPTLAPGQSGTFSVTLTNQGLVAAEGITLNLPTDSEYTFFALSTQIGTLSAKSSVVVPIAVTRSPSANDSASGSQTLVLAGTYFYVTGNRNISNVFMTTIGVPGRSDSAQHISDIVSSSSAYFTSAGTFNGSNSGGNGTGFSSAPTATNLLPPVLITASVSVPIKLQLSQGSTGAGSAVTGTLTLNNEGTTGALSNIGFNVIVTDSNGNPANGAFYISDPILGGALTAVDGSGVLPALASGTVAYTFIPTVSSAPNGPTVYNIGGTLSYVDPQTGGEVTTVLVPYPMTVNPVPLLKINYFLQQDVEQNDPAVLGMLVTNTGGAPADQLSLTAPQPQVVQTQTSVPLNFQIIGSQVGNQAATPSLTANFGDIQPGQTGDAAFYLLSSLQGEFLNFTATFSHSAPGGMLTSAISSVQTHLLIHAGDFMFPGSTGAIDYLVDDVANPSSLPDTVYLSNGSTAAVNLATGASASGTISNTQLSVQVTAQVTPGWDYIHLPDPGTGYTLSQVIRSDGTIIPVSDQAWTTDESFDSSGNATVDHELHFLDLNSTGSYTVYYQPKLSSISPALQWDPADGADVRYTVAGAPVPQDNTVDLFWASGPHFSEAIGGPIYAAGVLVPAGTVPGSYGPVQITDGVLGTPPAGATYLLAVADPTNLLGNFTDARNVQALPVLPDVILTSLSTADSRSLTVDYQVDFENVTAPLTITFYRSPTQQFDPNHNILLGTEIVSGLAIGSHEDKNIAINGGLAPNTNMPYVLAVANQDNSVAETTTANDTAYFRAYVIGAVCVGFDPSSLFTSTPSGWVQTMADDLMTQDGYQAVIPFTWDSASPNRQAVKDAGQTLFDDVELLATGLQVGPNDVIDVHLIGHSRGAVVVSEVAQDLASNQGIVPQMDHGYLKVTLLDPHPANNLYGFNASAFSLPVAAGYVAFQTAVQDPPVIIPPRVNEVDDLYETTPTTDLISLSSAFEGAILNLHGLSPADITVQDKSQTMVLAYNMTGPGIGHSEVHDWYETYVVDTRDLASDTTPSVLAPLSAAPASVVIAGQQVSSLTSASLQTILDSDPTPSILVNSANDLNTVIAAINGLYVQANSVSISVNLGNAVSFSDVTITPPTGVSVFMIGNGATTTIVGNSPALTVSSGTVIVTGVTFTTSTDAPTILIAGGDLVFRDDVIEESTGATDSAIEITNGTLDLGTTDSPGNNTVNINGTGEFLQNSTPNLVSDVGDTFSNNGTPLAAPLLSFTAAGTSAAQLLYGQSVTLTATVTPDSTESTAPTGSVDVFDTTTNIDLGSVQLSSGVASLNISALTVGSHAIVTTYSGDDYYLPSMDFLTETITPAPLTVTVDDKTMVYGGSLPSLSATYTGLVNGDTVATFQAAGNSPANLATVSANSSVGSYSIKVNGAADANYDITFVPGVLTITPAPLTITADNKTMVYGAMLPTLTGTLTGVVNGDNITASYSTTATPSSEVIADGYPITSTLNDPNNRLANYTLTNTTGTLTITPANQTITWANPADIVYGTALGASQLNATDSVVGPAAGGVLTYVPAAGTVLNAGKNQTLTVNAAATTDYAAASATVTINVDPATLTVTANPATRVYGQANPGFTDIITGFVNGDAAGVVTGSASLTSSATTTSPAGTYPIIAAQGNLSAANYTFAFVNGTLTIYPVPAAGLSGPSDGVAYQPRIYTFTGSGAPGDQAAGFTYQINWSDGSPMQTVSPTAHNTAIAESHAYTTTGTFTVSVTATDQYGATSPAATQTITIGLAEVQAESAGQGGITGLAISGTSAAQGVVLAPGTTANAIKVTRGGTLLGTFVPTNGSLAIYGDGGTDLATVTEVASSADTFALAGSTATFTAASLSPNIFTIALNNITTVALQGGNSGNSFTNTAATVASTLIGGSGTNTYAFAGNSMGAATTIQGKGSNNTLTGPTLANTWNITGGNAGNLNGTSWTFTGIQNLTGGSSTNAFVFSNGASVTGNLIGGAGGGTLNYASYAANVSINLQTNKATGVSGTSTNLTSAIGGSGTNTLTGANTANTWSITGANRGTVNTFTFVNFGNLTGGTVTDTFAVGTSGSLSGKLTGTASASTLVGPNVGSTFNITGKNAGSLSTSVIAAFTGIQNLTGGSSTNAFVFSNGASVTGNLIGGAGAGTLNYASYTTNVTVNLQTNKVTGVGGTATNLTGVIGGAGTNTITGANTNNTWKITGDSAGNINGTFTFAVFANLNGGSVNDDFAFFPGGSVSGNVNGEAPVNTLDYSQYGGPATVNLQTKTATGIVGTWANIQNFIGTNATDTLIGPNAASAWNITGANSGTVNSFTFANFANLKGGTGTNTFTVGNSGSLSGNLTGTSSANTLVGQSAANTFNITGSNAGNLSTTVIAAFAGIENLTGGTSPNAFLFHNGAGVTGNLNGGTGGGTLNYSTYTTNVGVNLQTNKATGVGGTATNLVGVTGGSGSNTLTGANTATTWNITANNAGNINGSFMFAAFANLTGGSANDTFVFGNGAGVSGTLNGGAGTNGLNYSAYLTGVYVNLLSGVATGTGGITHMQQVYGSGQGDALVGNGTGVLFVETAGRNLIIGGTGGNATLNSGSGQDIVIAGSTTYDTNQAALQAIENYWSTNGGTFAQRVAALSAGITGGYKLSSSTVTHHTGAGDTIALGSANDWLFWRMAGSGEDMLTGTSGQSTLI